MVASVVVFFVGLRFLSAGNFLFAGMVALEVVEVEGFVDFVAVGFPS